MGRGDAGGRGSDEAVRRKANVSTDWVQIVALGLLAVQSIGWLVTFIRMLRLADEISSASTIIVTKAIGSGHHLKFGSFK
jgi:hypothetical protein